MLIRFTSAPASNNKVEMSFSLGRRDNEWDFNSHNVKCSQKGKRCRVLGEKDSPNEMRFEKRILRSESGVKGGKQACSWFDVEGC